MRLVKILQFSENFELIFDNSNVNKRVLICLFMICIDTTLESEVVPTNCKSRSKTCSNIELVSSFSQTFMELIFATKIKTMLLKQPAVLLTSCQKYIAYIMCLST